MPAIIRLLPVMLVMVLLSGCAKPKPTLVVFVGGMGLSQLGDLRRAVTEKCPEADVVNAGGWDGYKADLAKIIHEKPRRDVILVGHSFGCSAIADAAKQTQRVDLAVFIEPAWDDFDLPRPLGSYLWYRRTDFDIARRANIRGAKPTTIPGGHNDLPHSPKVIAEIVQAVHQTVQNKNITELKPRRPAVARKTSPTPASIY